MRSNMRCFGDPKDTIDSKQLKNQIYLLRFGHTRALLLKKKGHEMAIFPVLGKLTHMCTWLESCNRKTSLNTPKQYHGRSKYKSQYLEGHKTGYLNFKGQILSQSGSRITCSATEQTAIRDYVAVVLI